MSIEIEEYKFSNGWTAKRETGLVVVPVKWSRSRQALFANGKWVLRDEHGEPVDMDKHRVDLFDRHQEISNDYRKMPT